MENSEFLNSGDKAIIGIVLCCLLVLAAIIVPKVFGYKKRIKLMQETRAGNVENILVQQTDSLKTMPEQKQSDYKSLFLVGADIPTRSGKPTSIREKYHKRIAKIVKSSGKKDVSIFSYIDNVLNHHFEAFRDEITEICNNNNDDDYFIPKK